MPTKNSPSNKPPADFIFQIAAALPGDLDRGPIFFAARTSGLFRSSDGGLTWESAYASLHADKALPTTSVALAPGVGCEPIAFAGLNGAILYSRDGGIHWQQSQLPSPPPAVAALAVSPNFAEDEIVFGGTNEDGILVSKDGGRKWSTSNFGLLDLSIVCLAVSPDFGRDETVYAGTGSGLFRSTNGGRAWQEIPLPVGFDAVLSLALSPQFLQDNTLWIGTENKGILLSHDRGKSWQRLSKATQKQPVNGLFLSPGFPRRQDIILHHGGTLLKSIDGGNTWNPWREKKVKGRLVTAVVIPGSFADIAIAGFADGGISRL